MPLSLAQGVAGALAALWWLALACLCGDILARHGRLWGLDQGVRKASAPLEERRQWVQLCAGRFDKVLLSTGKSLTHKGATVADWQRYDRLLEITGREDERRSQAPAYLEKWCLLVPGPRRWCYCLVSGKLPRLAARITVPASGSGPGYSRAGAENGGGVTQGSSRPTP